MARILHFADLHLDSSFASIGMTSSEATRRREELRAALRRIVDLALELDVDAVTVGGDLYEHDRVTRDTGHFIAGQFERLAPKPVMVAPGNHDRYVPDSLYRRLDWPANVRIFDALDWAPATAGSDLVVWGAAHNGPAVRDNLLRSLRLEASERAIALLHGSDMSAVPEGKATHCPFDASDVEQSGAAFVLLGHYHSMRLSPTCSPRYGYPGSPEPLGFDEEGPHYVLLLAVEGDDVSAEPIQINEVSYRAERVDVEGMSTSDQVRESIASLSGSDARSPDIVRVVLSGQAEPDLDINVEGLLATTVQRFRHLDIIDETHASFNLDELSEEATTRGSFVRLMQAKIDAAPGSERQLLENALRHGLRAFAGQEVRPR